MKTTIFFVMLIQILAATARAGANIVYTDASGVKWTEFLPGKYSNGCQTIYSQPRRYDCSGGSDASAACDAINAKLPTQAQIYRLIADFDHYVGHYPSGTKWYLTSKGFRQFRSTIGSTELFWSSTYTSNDRMGAYIFGWSSAHVASSTWGTYKVRCVMD